jgi:hypothetical protein
LWIVVKQVTNDQTTETVSDKMNCTGVDIGEELFKFIRILGRRKFYAVIAELVGLEVLIQPASEQTHIESV